MRQPPSGGAFRPLSMGTTTLKKGSRATAISQTTVVEHLRAAGGDALTSPMRQAQQSFGPVLGPDALRRGNRRADQVLAKMVADAESQEKPNPSYFSVVQRNKFTKEARRNVITWMQRCSFHFRLLPETLESAIYMFDRFLSLVHVPGDKHVRVIGVACVFLASKLSEAMEDGPSLRDLVVASGTAFSVNEIMRMERIILNKLTWNVGNIVTSSMVALLVLDSFARTKSSTFSVTLQEKMQEHVLTTLRDVQTEAFFMQFTPTEMAAGACIAAALRTDPTANAKAAYGIICDVTRTDAANVSRCHEGMERIAEDVAPLF